MRVLTFNGSGYTYGGTIPLGYDTAISNRLNQDGWGILSFNIDPSFFSVPFHYNYNFVLTINVPDNENVERVKAGLTASIGQVLSDVSLVLANDSSGQTFIPDDSILGSIQQSILGNNPSTLSTVGTVSIGTVLLIGVGLLAIMLVKNAPTNPMRYLRGR